MSGIVSRREGAVRNEEVCHYKCQMPQRKGRERKRMWTLVTRGLMVKREGKL